MGWVSQHIMDEFGGSPNYVFDYTDLYGPDVQRILEPLKKTYPNFKYPDYAFATNWQDDDSAYGSWNAFKDDETLDNNDYYAYYAPRNGRLWLSGASSCRRHYSTMHGAHFAGVRDGHWVADCLEDSARCDESARPKVLPNGTQMFCDIYDFPLPPL